MASNPPIPTSLSNYGQMSLSQQQQLWHDWLLANNGQNVSFLSSNQGAAVGTAPAPVTPPPIVNPNASTLATKFQTAESTASPVLQAWQVKSQSTQQAAAQAAQATAHAQDVAAQAVTHAQDVAANNLSQQLNKAEQDASVLVSRQDDLKVAQSRLDLAQQTADTKIQAIDAHYDATVADANKMLADAQTKATAVYNDAVNKYLAAGADGGPQGDNVLTQLHDAIPTTSDPGYQKMLQDAAYTRDMDKITVSEPIAQAKLDVETRSTAYDAADNTAHNDFMNLPGADTIADPAVAGRVSAFNNTYQTTLKPGSKSPASDAGAENADDISSLTQPQESGGFATLNDANGDPILFAGSVSLPSASYGAGNSGFNMSAVGDGTVIDRATGTVITDPDLLAQLKAPPIEIPNAKQPPAQAAPSAPASPLPAHAGMMEGFGGLAAEAGSGYGLFESVRSGSILGAVTSFAGLYAGMKMIGGALSSSLSDSFFANGSIMSNVMPGSFGSFFDKIPLLNHAYNWIMNHQLMTALIVAAIIVAIALLTKKPNAAEQQIANFDSLTVYSPGNVLTLASAAALFSLAYNINTPSATLNGPGMNISVSNLKLALASGLSNADGSAYSGDIPYNTPIVLKGQAPGGGDEVLLINQAGIQKGTATDSIQKYDLANNMTFSKPTATAGTAGQVGAYIPFFVNGQPNPQAVTATNSQRGLLAATPALSAASQTGAVATAGAMDKSGVVVNP